MIDAIQERRAAKEFSALRTFYVHVLIFVPVMILLGMADALGGGATWAPWIGAGWLIAVLIHGHEAFVATPRRMAAWEERELASGGLSREQR